MAPITLKIDDVEYVRKDSVTVEKRKEGIYEIGEKYYVETATYAYHGTLISANKEEMILTKCSRIFSCGRFFDFMKNEPDTNLEVEPMFSENNNPEVVLSRSAVIMFVRHDGSFEKQVPAKN